MIKFSAKSILKIGALSALSAVVLGAFGAHGLKDLLITQNSTSTWETAVRFQMWHSLALILISLLKSNHSITPSVTHTLILGIILFSGSLYGIALGGPTWLGPITPLGGMLLITSWLLIAFRTKLNTTQSTA